MYLIMCYEIEEIDGNTVTSKHPVFTTDSKDKINRWFIFEPRKIIKYLNDLGSDKWEIKERTRVSVTIWNKRRTAEREYSLLVLNDDY